MSDQFEDPHHSHHSYQPDNLTRLAHDLKVLTEIIMLMSIDCDVGHTCSPPITRSNMKGIIAKKSTKFMGCLKNLHFLGEQMNRTRYSIRKNKTITFSENKTKSDHPDLDEKLRKMLVGHFVGVVYINFMG